MRQIQNRLTQWVKPIHVWWALIVVGIILRIRQYLSGRSLWADEASLAFNLANRSFAGLTQPLDYDQGAPIGFLFIEKLLVIGLGNIDQVMRLFPLFSGILAIYLFYRISQTHIKGGMLGVLLFSVSWSLIYYSSELKQYSSDVMIGLLLIFLASRCLKENAQARDFLLLGVTGVVAIWMSHPSAFILAGIGLAMFVATITKNRSIPILWLLGLGSIWLVSFGLEYLVSLRHLIANDMLFNYWKKAFMPLPPGGTRVWLVNTYYSLLLTTLGRTDPILVILVPALVLIGGTSLFLRERSIAIMTISPFFFALLASTLQKYPLKDRFMLFLVPLTFLLITEGLARIYLIIAKWHSGVASTVYIFPALVLFLLSASGAFEFFQEPQIDPEIKPVMEYVTKHRQENDIIYVYYTTVPVVDYYAPFYGLDNKKIFFGYRSPLKKAALEGFYRDVETLRGRDRVWFIFSGILDCGGCEGDMQLFYVNYLDELGTMLDGVHAVGANAYLYDLNP